MDLMSKQCDKLGIFKSKNKRIQKINKQLQTSKNKNGVKSSSKLQNFKSGDKISIAKSNARLQVASKKSKDSTNYDTNHSTSNKSSCHTENDPATDLFEKVKEKLRDNVEMDLEHQMDTFYQTQKDKMKAEYEKAEQDLVEAMKQYVKVEDEVCELENYHITEQNRIDELVHQWKQIYEQIEQEKLTDPETIQKMCDVDKEIDTEKISHQGILKSLDLKRKAWKEQIDTINKDFNHALDNQLNIQILNEKPYMVGIQVDAVKKYTTGSSKTQSQTDYFESVDKFTKITIDGKDYEFDKIIWNDEINYFKTDSITKSNTDACIDYKQELCDYLIKYLSCIIKFIRRIQKHSNFFKESLQSSKSNGVNKNEQQANQMNRKITFVFVQLEHTVLQTVLQGVQDIIGDDQDNVHKMFEDLLEVDSCEEIKRANLLTPNFDGSFDWEIEIISIKSASSDIQKITRKLVQEWKEQERMMNVFIDIKNTNDLDQDNDYKNDLKDTLNALSECKDQYVTSNSHLFFF